MPSRRKAPKELQVHTQRVGPRDGQSLALEVPRRRRHVLREVGQVAEYSRELRAQAARVYQLNCLAG